MSRLPWRGINTSNSKRVIVKFVNRKQTFYASLKKVNTFTQQRLRNKLSISYYRFLWGTCKNLQGKGLINQAFCLSVVVTFTVRENGPQIKILHEDD